MNLKSILFDRRRIWIRLAVLAVAVPVILFVTMRMRARSAPVRVVVSMDSKGNARLYGISLSNTNIRNAVFRVMGSAGLKVSARMPASVKPMSQQGSNIFETLIAIERAGLFATNTAPAPNPYE